MAANWFHFVVPLGILGLTLAAGLVVKRVLFRTLKRWLDGSTLRGGEALVESIRGAFMIWVLILGLHLATQSLDLSRARSELLAKVLLILWILSVTTVATRLAAGLVRIYGAQVHGALPVTSLSQTFVRLTVITIGVLIILNVLGVSITPMLTALGVGGLAVALALQSTLSNVFAGFHISVANQIRVGDYIKLSSGEEGYVIDINWRSTSVRMLANNLIIIPNAKLAETIVTNYHLPEKRMSLLIPVGVSYDSDPDIVERTLIEEAVRGAREIPGLLAEPQPFVRFIPGFGDSSLNFTLICQVAEFVDQYAVQHELRKRIFKRFREMGIEIPFPIRTVYLRGQAENGRKSSTRMASAGDT
jgi:small-conductance mechanosensitive channel